MTGFAPTSEQEDALAKFRTGDSLAIEAGAGAGKTSTLKLLAQQALDEGIAANGQYIAFNSAIVQEAKAKMPRNVRSNTAHSLAMAAVGKRFRHRLDKNQRMRSSDIANRLSISEIKVVTQDGSKKTLSRAYLAGLVMRSLVRFCQSADAMPGPEHVPYIAGIDIPPGRKENNHRVAKEIAPFIRLAWLDACDENGSLPYRHDYYLKLWQLSEPVIYSQFIMFDEAQDANPVMVAIVTAQEHAQLVWVGDSQQQIYSFTGAVNALQSVPAQQRSFLTQSFRFGPEIAEVANQVLSALDAELRLTGTETIPSRVCATFEPNVILTRTNATAVRSVLAAQTEGKTVHLVGGGKEIVAFAKGAQDLMSEGRTTYADLACFDSWSEVLQYVSQDEQGSELRLNVKLVEEFGVDVILAALDNMVREDRADLTVSTAHKSKGREWDAVRLADDFPETPQNEELRLLYVAVTRAKLSLDITGVRYFNPVDASAPATVEQEDEPESGGWVYVSAADLAEIRECDCELCRVITAEGVTPAESVRYNEVSR